MNRDRHSVATVRQTSADPTRPFVRRFRLSAAAGRADNASAAERPPVVTLVTRDGRQIRGERWNEDAFSIQIAETNGRLQRYLKAPLRDIVRRESAATERRPCVTVSVTSQNGTIRTRHGTHFDR